MMASKSGMERKSCVWRTVDFEKVLPARIGHWWLTLSVALLLTSLAAPVWSASSVQTLIEFNARNEFAEGRFAQTTTTQAGRIKQQAKGRFAFSKPGRFKWEIEKPYPQLIVSDGKEVISYDPDLAQASSRPLGQAMDSTPAALLFGTADLGKLFQLSEDGNQGGLDWVKAKPLEKESLFEYLRIGFSSGQPQLLEIHDALGQVTRIEFLEWRSVTRRPTDYFNFKVPPGVDLIQSR